jgi:hypothetical protein
MLLKLGKETNLKPILSMTKYPLTLISNAIKRTNMILRNYGIKSTVTILEVSAVFNRIYKSQERQI